MGSTIKYDVLALYASVPDPTGNLTTGDIRQFSRVQSSNYSIEIQREEGLMLGTANANENILIGPLVNLDINYLSTNGQNERNLGFAVDGMHGSLFSLNSGVRDYFMLVDSQTDPTVVAIGNGILTRYSVNGAVGDFLKASASIQGFNIKVDAGTSGNTVPSVNEQGVPNSQYTYALPPIDHSMKPRSEGGIEDNIFVGPGNMTIAFPNNSALGIMMSGENKSHLQSFDLSVALERTEVN